MPKISALTTAPNVLATDTLPAARGTSVTYKYSYSQIAPVVVGSSILSGASDPTGATVGFLGQVYVNTTTDAYFVCVDASGPYVWVASESNNLSGVVDPTTATVGAIGQLYINTANNTAFVCTNILVGPLYTWILISNAIGVTPALWDANTNTPTLVGGVGNEGDIYIVSVAGNTDLDGTDNWIVGQVVSFTGGQWFKNPSLNPNCIVFSNNSSNLQAEPSYIKFVETDGTISIYNDDTSTTYDTITINPRLSITKSSTTGESVPQLVLKTFSNASLLPSLMLLGSRGTDQNAATTLLAGDRFGSIEFGGFTSVANQNNLSGAIYQTVESAVPGTLRATMNFASIDGVIMSMSSNRYTQFNDLVRITHAFGTGAIPSSITDPQMFFYPAKAAFRAGQVTLGQWHDVNIGNWSTAFGRETNASADGAFAIGDGSTVNGNWGFAGGTNSVAGAGSFAFGSSANASSGSNVSLGGFLPTSSSSGASTIGGNANTTSGTFGGTLGGGLNSNAGTYSCMIGSIVSNIGPNVTSGVLIGGVVSSITGTTTGSIAIGNGTITNNYNILINADNAALSSTKDNQILLSAANGVGINTNTPSADLQVNGRTATGVGTTAVSTTTALINKEIIGVTDTSAPRTITLSNIHNFPGSRFTIKDQSNGAGTNPITIQPQTGTIDGFPSVQININRGSLSVYCDPSNNWFVI